MTQPAMSKAGKDAAQVQHLTNFDHIKTFTQIPIFMAAMTYTRASKTANWAINAPWIIKFHMILCDKPLAWWKSIYEAGDNLNI